MPPKAHTSVEGFLADLQPPLKAVLEDVRGLILGLSGAPPDGTLPVITEGIQWNCVSFRVDEWFATLNVHPAKTPYVLLVLHRGAKVGGAAPVVADPAGLLEWRGPARAVVRIASASDLDAKRAPLRAIVAAWVAGGSD